jgi:flagellar basal-body rod protein FlgG
MIKGLYTSASGMIPHLKKQEATANNLANVGTAGFKKDAVFTHELSRAERKLAVKKSDWEKPMVNDLFTDYSQGIFSKTGNPLDMGIDGEGFFTLQTADGGTYLTRSGSFTVDADGMLAFPGGAVVLGEGGPIEIGSGQVSVAENGEIEVDGNVVGRIIPQTVADLSSLEKVGDSLFAVPEGTTLIAVPDANIRQGFLEQANVDIVREMIDMIISFRAYEANARSVQTQDKSLDHLFGRVGGKQ